MIETKSIVEEIYSSTQRLQEGSGRIFLLAKEMAIAEREYTKAMALVTLELKGEGMSITLISTLAKGRTADLKFDMDLATEKYIAGKESLKAIQAQLSGLQTILRYQQDI